MGWLLLLVLGTTVSLAADSIRLVSANDLNAIRPAGGNGPSVAPQITPDGRWVLFTSSASDLVTNPIGNFACNLFLRDRASNITTLVSVNLNGAGGSGDSLYGQVSTNGRYVVFQSDAADLVAGDTNGVTDIFVRDVLTGTTTLASVASDGSSANGASTDPVMTPDAHYVAFISTGTNLTAGDTNGIPDIYLRDLVASSNELITLGATGAVATLSVPVITSDGEHIAFYSTAKGLVAIVPNSLRGEIYVRNRVSNTTIWASTNASDIASNLLNLISAPSYHPSISEDGRFVTFKTGWTNGAAAPGGSGVPAVLVFQFDSSSNTTTMIGTNGFASWQNCDDSYGPEVSPDGKLVTYVATNQDAHCLTIQLWDAEAGTNLDISLSLDGSWPTNSISENPTVSADGRFVCFMSNATNLTTNVVAYGFHMFRRDTQAGTTTLVDADNQGLGWGNLTTATPTLSSNGKLVSFDSPDGNLMTNDNNLTFDVFVRDLDNAETELISQHASSQPAAGCLGSTFGVSSLSADGQRMVFSSYASDLVTNDFNNSGDVFLTDLQSGSTTLISTGMDGNPALGGDSMTPAISADGHFVVFASTATNLVANDTNKAADIFLRNLDTGTITLINVNSNGVTSGTGDASAPAISANGRYVSFLAKVTLASTYPSTFWKDTIGGRMATVSGITSVAPSISADGQRVLFLNGSSTISYGVWNAPTFSTIYSSGNVSFVILSPTGARLAYQAPSPKQLVVYNLAGGTNMFSCTNSTAMKNTLAWSSDGRYLTFVTGASLIASDINGTNDVYLCDLQTGMVNLISANSGWTASANGISDSPSISGDGRFIVFRSFATNIIPGITNIPSLFVFDRTTGSNELLSTAAPNGWASFASLPVLSSNGNSIAFQSWNMAGVTNNLNRIQNVFSAAQNSLISDSDSNGIPDWWTLQHFDHAEGQQGDLSRASDDADGDGLTNAQEYFCGTDPTNPNSVFALQMSPSTANTVSLTWPATPGKTYQVQYKDNLKGANWTNYSGSISLIGRQGVITTSTSQTNRFYRAVCVN